MKIIENEILDQERALYGIQNANIFNCTFDGPADGESALKECDNIYITNSNFKLRYPLWHVNNAHLVDCLMSESCRAALWYDKHIVIKNCNIQGIKAVRECSEITIENSSIISDEFGWMSDDITIKDSKLSSEYPFFHSKNIYMNNFNLKGKYSFQYVENVAIKNSYLDTKDAFWHCKNVTVTDSVVKGEYLGWYSENLKLVRCKIIGTQPLCYTKGLVLEDCTMIDCDLAFEKSDVRAVIKGSIKSVKNPGRGYISADSIGEIILDDNQPADTECEIEIRKELVHESCV